jgi:GntR family transcriptional regulator
MLVTDIVVWVGGPGGEEDGVKRARVREQLLTLIEGRGPGELIPSERELSERLGVSRPTLRAAVDDLAQAGLLVRQHGRGTFTSARKVTQEITPSTMTEFYAPPAEGNWLSRVLSFEVAPAGAQLGHRLRVSPSEPVLNVTRLRLVGDEPMAIEKIQLPAAVAPGLAARDLESGSLYQLLRVRYQVVVTDAVQTIEPTVTDATEAELLGVPLYAPALMFERTTQDSGGRVVEYVRSTYRGDRYRITTHLRFDSESG